MAFFHPRPSWFLPERSAISEAAYVSRRTILAASGLGGLGLLGSSALLGACLQSPKTGADASPPDEPPSSRPSVLPDGPPESSTDAPAIEPASNYPDAAQAKDLYPAKRNPAYQVSERPLTDESPVQQYNNFYEFSLSKEEVWKKTSAFTTVPWTLEIAGLVQKPFTLDLDALIRRLGLEERVYRFRCVEAWAMTVPWVGFSLASLIRLANPLASAKFVRFLSVERPSEMPGMASQTWYPWPYFEGLRIDEATHDLAFVATGIFGHPLTRQMGAPVRLVLPWKYGFKGPKSIVKLEFTSVAPKTFWSTLVPQEYGFYGNVHPQKPHPRWSQATERLLPDGKEVPTQLYNGYANEIASLYKGDEF